jgi:hypothetical protein
MMETSDGFFGNFAEGKIFIQFSVKRLLHIKTKVRAVSPFIPSKQSSYSRTIMFNTSCSVVMLTRCVCVAPDSQNK